jgi:hypothetical protein
MLENSIFVISKIYLNVWEEKLRKRFEEIRIGGTPTGE